MNKLLITLLIMVAGMSACQQKDDTAPDVNNVIITITSPKAGQVFKSGDTVAIQATVTYPSELHGYEVKLVDTTTGLVVYDDDQHVHTDHFVIDDRWISAATQATSLKLSIIASIDHDGDDARKDLNIQIVP